jgi:membrane protease YdiL (CAAX protease family)
MSAARYTTTLGIFLSLLGPAVLAVVSNRSSSTPSSLGIRASELVAFVVLVGCVVAIAKKGERLTWSDVGFGHTSWLSFAWAAGLAGFFIFVFGPLASAALTRLGVGSYDTGLAKETALPVWYLILTVVIVAAGEEWLYRGYAIGRLEAATGNAWVAGGISLAAFALAHVPMWGFWPSLTTIVSGGILTALYIWRRDVTFLMLAHVVTDLYGIVILPVAAGRH